jgi:hypothetical protein
MGGSGASRTVTFLPWADQSGDTAVYLAVANPRGGQASTSFRLAVQRAAATATPTATPTVATVPLATLPPGVPAPGPGGTAVAVQPGASGSVGVVAVEGATLGVPAPVFTPVGVRLQPLTALPVRRRRYRLIRWSHWSSRSRSSA